MAEALKHIYNEVFFKEFTVAIKKILPGFNHRKFIAEIKNESWQQLELKQRMRRIAAVLHDALKGNYKEKLAQLLKIMDALPQKSAGLYGSLAYMLIPDFVEQYGLENPDLSLKAMEKISEFTSCEFAIRPYLLKYPQKVMAQMLAWSKHKNENIRRFASEGCRPRLPWAMAIPFLKKDPSPILPILENLKNDSSAFVRRSVANNLNDISKDHPELVIEIAKNWMGKFTETDWIVRHACRGLLKKGNKETLHLFGTGNHIKCLVQNLRSSSENLSMGEQLTFNFSLLLIEKKPAKLRVEYAVYFMKANGKPSRKIFKIAEAVYPPDKPVAFVRRHSFRDLTTRKHYSGLHTIAIVVNGNEGASVNLQLNQPTRFKK
jgi:3-methyladenine DNA glycosylase AlkC